MYNKKIIKYMIHKLYVFANMGFLDQLPKSGGQTSARRVMDGLRQSGFEIVPIRRHRGELESKWGHRMEIGYFAIWDALKIVAKMLFSKRKGAAFLHLTYAGPLVPYELFLTKLVRLMGYPALEYLKGGQVMDMYPNGNANHKAMFKKNLDLQKLVMFEGEASMQLAASVSNSPMIYFPNYIFDEKIPSSCPKKPAGEIGLCYFGRISPDKNVHIGIEAFNMLCERHPDWNLHYTMVGGKGKSAEYIEKVKNMIEESPYRDMITFAGNSPQEYLIQMMQSHHIFIFPSKEPCEGHSNALNEAMSQGLVPVVSDYHFNRAIVCNDSCVVNSFEAKDYADTIEKLIQDGSIEKLSNQMWQRVKDLFAYSKVNESISNTIKNII